MSETFPNSADQIRALRFCATQARFFDGDITLLEAGSVELRYGPDWERWTAVYHSLLDASFAIATLRHLIHPKNGALVFLVVERELDDLQMLAEQKLCRLFALRELTEPAKDKPATAAPPKAITKAKKASRRKPTRRA